MRPMRRGSDGPVLGVVTFEVPFEGGEVVGVVSPELVEVLDGGAAAPDVAVGWSAGGVSVEEDDCGLLEELDGGFVEVLLDEITPLTIAITKPVIISPATTIAPISKRMRLVMKIVYPLTTRYVDPLIVARLVRSCNEDLRKEGCVLSRELGFYFGSLPAG